MDSADTVGRLRVFQRFAHTKVAEVSITAAPGTKYMHLGDTTAANAVPKTARVPSGVLRPPLFLTWV